MRFSTQNNLDNTHSLVTYAPKDGVMDFKTVMLVPATPAIGHRLAETLATEAKNEGKTLKDALSTMYGLRDFFAGYVE